MIGNVWDYLSIAGLVLMLAATFLGLGLFPAMFLLGVILLCIALLGARSTSRNSG